jgi:signal transduction histidine kinase
MHAPSQVHEPGAGLAGRGRDHRQLRHDIDHELATISLLASLLTTAEDVGPVSRRRAAQLLDESRWLRDLIAAADDTPRHSPAGTAALPVRLDLVAVGVVHAATLSTARVHLDAEETWAPVEALAFRRVLTNLVGNAVRAAGRYGEVRVTVREMAGTAVVRVEDDGPGFGVGPTGLASLGLGIVLDLVDAMGGELDLGSDSGGGCRIEVRLPATRTRCDEAA